MEQQRLHPQEAPTKTVDPTPQSEASQPAEPIESVPDSPALEPEAVLTAGTNPYEVLLAPITGIVTHLEEVPTARWMPSQEYEVWFARLQQLASKQKMLNRILMGLFSIGYILFLLLNVAQKMGWITKIPWFGYWISLTYTFAILGAWLVRLRWKMTAQDLGKSGDIRAIGTLIEGWKEHSIAKEPVIPMLYRLQASDSSLLNREHRQILNRCLGSKVRRYRNYRNNVALVHAILKAYEQVGDSEAIPFVQRLANGEGYAARESGIQQEAQACLIYLHQRAQQQQAQQTLLRAAGEETSSANLLRPSEGATQVDPQQLLRASQGQVDAKETP